MSQVTAAPETTETSQLSRLCVSIRGKLQFLDYLVRAAVADAERYQDETDPGTRIFIRQLQILGSTMGSLGEFGDLLSLVQRSGLKPVIDSEYGLDDVHAALDRLESGAQFGKVVVHIGANS